MSPIEQATGLASRGPRRTWIAAPFAAGLVICALHVLNLAILDGGTLSLGAEGSPLTLAAAGLFLIGGGLALWAAATDRRHRPGWLALGVTGILFGLEEGGLMLHERFEEATSTGVGLIAAALLAAGLLLVIVRYGSARLPSPAPGIVVVAAIALLLSQLLGAAATRSAEGIARDILAVGEECGEITIAALLLVAALSLVRRRPVPDLEVR